MGSLRITGFGGIRPKTSRTMDTRGLAQVAHNTRLWKGTVAPFREACKVATADINIRSMYRKDQTWIVSDNRCASFAEGDPACNLLFATGVAPWPAYTAVPYTECNNIADVTWTRLGLPIPPKALIVSALAPSPSQETEFGIIRTIRRDVRAWTYCYVDSMGREGPLSPISDIVNVDLDANVTVRIPADTFDPSFDVVKVHLYRVVPVAADASVDITKMDSAPLFSGEFNHIAGGNYTILDDLNDEELGGTAVCEKFFAPPEDLQGLIALPNGIMVGFVGRDIWFSEPWEFHAWNCHMRLDDCIRKIIYNSNAIYVLTDGHPYVVEPDSSAPESCRCCRTAARSEIAMPILDPQSATELSNGVMWASSDGLAIMRGAAPAISNSRYIDSKAWRSFRPESMRGVLHLGRYHGFCEMVEPLTTGLEVYPKGFLWDFDESTYASGDVGLDSNLVTHDIPADAVFKSRDGGLYLAYGNEIRQWDESSFEVPYIWRSKVIVDRGFNNYACAKVVAEEHFLRQPIGKSLYFTLYVDGRVYYTRSITSSAPFRLPSVRYGIDFEIEIRGTAEVNEIHLATSMQELTLVNGA